MIEDAWGRLDKFEHRSRTWRGYTTRCSAARTITNPTGRPAARILEIEPESSRCRTAEPRVPRAGGPVPCRGKGNPPVPRHRLGPADRQQRPRSRAVIRPGKPGRLRRQRRDRPRPRPRTAGQHPRGPVRLRPCRPPRHRGASSRRQRKSWTSASPSRVLLFAILHFVPDQDDPWGIAGRLMDAVPPGSYLAVSHATPENLTDPASKELLDKVYAETRIRRGHPTAESEIERFFTGLEMTDPGVVSISAWRPAPGDPANANAFLRRPSAKTPRRLYRELGDELPRGATLAGTPRGQAETAPLRRGGSPES